MRLSHRKKLKSKQDKQHYLIVKFANKNMESYVRRIKNISNMYEIHIKNKPRLVKTELNFTPVASTLQRVVNLWKKVASFLKGAL